MNRSYSSRAVDMVVAGLIVIVLVYFTAIMVKGIHARYINQSTEALLYVECARSPYTGVRSCSRHSRSILRQYLSSL